MPLTAAEQKTLDDIAAAQARGEDPFGDNDNSADTGADDANTDTADNANGEGTGEATADDAGTGTGDGGTADDQIDEAALAAIANDDPAIPEDPLQFNVQAPADYKTARAALLTEETEAFAKMMDGEMDAKEYAAIKVRVMDGLEDLSAQRIRAETLLEANAQTAAKSQGAVIQALIVRAENEVPYATDTKAQKQFDMALKLQLDDPDNAGKPFAHAVNEAHKVVLAMRGIQAKPAATTPAAPRKPAGDAPVTLRSIPAAATPNTGGSITDQLARLSGQEYEAAYAKLTPAQRAAMLED